MTVTTPGLSTCRVGTWAGRMPKAPVSVGTSTCFTLASLKNTCRGKEIHIHSLRVQLACLLKQTECHCIYFYLMSAYILSFKLLHSLSFFLASFTLLVTGPSENMVVELKPKTLSWFKVSERNHLHRIFLDLQLALHVQVQVHAPQNQMRFSASKENFDRHWVSPHRKH